MSSLIPPLSVVHLLAPARFGGLETVVVSLVAEQSRQGDRVCAALVLSPLEAVDHPLIEMLDAVGVAVEPIIVEGRAYRRERQSVREILERRGAAVLHTHGYRPDVIDAPVARRMGIPTVTTVHGFTGGSWRNRFNEWLQMRALRQFDAVIAVSEKLGHELTNRGLAPGRVHTVRNAWKSGDVVYSREEARSILGLPQRGRIVGWVGRFTQEKGPDVMVRAAAGLTEEALISMVGAGPKESECRVMARTLGLADRFRWHGVQPEAARLLPAFDLIVITSWSEGTPMVLLEAMAAGVPVVTTSVGGIPEVVTSREAHLCDAGEAGQIGEAIDDVLADPLAAQRRAASARRRLLSDFAVDPWADRHRSIYSSLLID